MYVKETTLLIKHSEWLVFNSFSNKPLKHAYAVYQEKQTAHSENCSVVHKMLMTCQNKMGQITVQMVHTQPFDQTQIAHK